MQAGINCSARMGPVIECYNKLQQFELGEEANGSFGLSVFKVMFPILPVCMYIACSTLHLYSPSP